MLIPFLLAKLHSAVDVVPGRIAEAYGASKTSYNTVSVYMCTSHMWFGSLFRMMCVYVCVCHVLDEGLRPLQGFLHAFQGKPTTFGLSLLASLLLLGAVNSHLHKFLLAQLGNMWFKSNEINISEMVHYVHKIS